MCYNCGCGMPNDDMGVGHLGVDKDGKALTDETFKIMAEEFGMTVEEAKQYTFELLEKELKKK